VTASTKGDVVMGQARYTYRVCPTCGQSHKTGERCEQCEAAATHSQSSDGDARVARVAQSLRPAISRAIEANDWAVLTAVLDRRDQKGDVMPDDQLTPAELTDLDARAAEVLAYASAEARLSAMCAMDDRGEDYPAAEWEEMIKVTDKYQKAHKTDVNGGDVLPLDLVHGYQKVRAELAAAKAKYDHLRGRLCCISADLSRLADEVVELRTGA